MNASAFKINCAHSNTTNNFFVLLARVQEASSFSSNKRSLFVTIQLMSNPDMLRQMMDNPMVQVICQLCLKLC